MTREEKLIMEFAESETMQIKNKDKWADLDQADFRCSPDKYRPFKSQEECWQEMQKHQPFGWVKEKVSEGLYLIYCINNCIDTIYDINSFEEAINIYEFMDGTPFGIKED